MKKLLFQLLIIVHFCVCFFGDSAIKASIRQDPLLVCAIMIKNEALVIEDTLKGMIDGGIDVFLVFDTGSTDNTLDVVKSFFKSRAITSFVIEQEPFVDFATSRNRALELVDQHFPDATFVIMPDAEWYIHNAQAILQFCNEHKNDFHDSYLISIRSATQAFYVSRLIRCRRNIKFVGAVHEALNKISTITLPDNIYFEWRPSQKGKEKSALRWQRDRDLLLKSYAENPTDARTLFYLAQTYECLGDWENAYIFYMRRSAIQGWDEENFVTRLRLGDVANRLGSRDGESICPQAINHYLEAFSLRPWRAEPLVKMAQFYIDRGLMHMAFLFASRAVNIPYPAKDILFVEKYLYDYVRYDVLGRCAWYVGEYKLGKWAILKALDIEPEATHLKYNLKIYSDCC